MYEETLETKPKNNNYRIALIIWILFFALWIFLSIKPVKLFISWEKATGTIVWVTPHEQEDDDWGTYYTYTPTIQYTCGWEKVRSEPRSSSSTKYKVWRSITVFCDPTSPKTIFIPSDFLILTMPIMGLLVLIIFWYNMISNRKQTEKKPAPSGNFMSIMGISFGFLIFWMVLCFMIYSGINDGDLGSLIWIVLFSIPIRLLRKGLSIQLKDYIRIKTAKSKIEKWGMVIIQATVIWFQHAATLMDKAFYRIKCSDWTMKYDSEEIEWEISWHDDTPMKYLEMLEIIYDPKNPQKTLEELDAHPKYMMIPSYYEETSQRLTKQIAAWEDYEYPYWIFNWKKVTVWDSINVYIDPNNRKLYLVDLSFLK